MIIGISVYLAEIYISKNRTLGEITLQTIRNLVANEKTSNGTATTFTYRLDDLINVEENSKEIWIYAYDLAWELDNNKISEAVISNAKKGINYKYIIPNENKIVDRVRILQEKYLKLGLTSDSIQYKKRTEDLKFIRFGVIIYNPTISGKNINGNDCTVVFFPRFTEYKDGTDDIFLCLRGGQTLKFQEDFNSMWNGSTKELNE